MAVQNQQIKEIVQLLWSGDTTEAKRLIAVESANLESQLTVLKADFDTLKALNPSAEDQLSLEEAGLGATQRPEVRKLTLAQKRRRALEILNAADEILQNKEEFTSDEIAEILLKSGIAMGVPENRITTAIGGVLKKHKDKYERIGNGVYTKVNHDLLEQSSHKDI